jgi:DNA-binding NarL/FixJ family response regulator
MNKIGVMLAEDHRTLREGLKMLLEVEGDIQVVAEAESGKEAVATAQSTKCDVVLMDIALVGLDGIEATRLLRQQAPQIAIVMLSAHPEVHLVRAALEAGALGYLLKRATGNELREAVRAASKQTPYFSAEVMRAVKERTRTPPPRTQPDPTRAENPEVALTDREYEILQLIASGHSNREIAEILRLSVKTIETHRMHLMEKLDIHDVASLTRYAIRKGMIE